MPAATFKVEISWQSAASGTFKLDVSQIDGGSVLDGTGVVDFAGTYDDVTADVESIHIRRGRDDALKDIQAGECEIVLFHPSNFDYYNPNAPGGIAPINSVQPGFDPMRPVRISATYNATTYYLFFGYIRSADWDSTTKRTRINAVDTFLWLSRITPSVNSTTVANAGVTNTSTMIGHVLDYAGFTDATKRTLDTPGDTITSGMLSASQYSGNTTALNIIQDFLASERGVAYAKGNGAFRYRTRLARYQTNSSATIGYSQLRYGSAIDLDRIINRQTVARQDNTGTTTFIAGPVIDALSQSTYGVGDAGTLSTQYLATNAAATGLANFLLKQKSTPQPPISLVVDNQDDATILLQLGLELGDRITAPLSYSKFTFGVSTFDGIDSFAGNSDFHVEQIEHTISDAGIYHTTTLLLSQRGAEVLRFGNLPVGTDFSPSQFGSTSAAFAY